MQFTNMDIIEKKAIIFKAFEAADNVDTYEKKFTEEGLLATIIPPIDFEFCNLEFLREKLFNPISYSGIVFTSPRSVKAVMLCLQEQGNLPLVWSSYPVFVVGEATHQSVNNLLGLMAEGKECGSAKDLADKISTRAFDKPLLFPCGNLKTDILTSLLRENGITVEDIIVYRTCQHLMLEENIKEVVNKGFPEFIIFFSPSGVKYTVPLLKKLSVPWKNIKFVCIGPSTEAAVKEQELHVWSVSKRPNPDCLIDAVLNRSTN